MITTILTKLPSELGTQLLTQSLDADDAILLTAASIALAYQPCTYQTQAFVRQTDIEMCGGVVHADWKVISDTQWCQLLLNATKNVSW